MPRKQRKTITKEIFDIVISMFNQGIYNIQNIASTVKLNRNTVGKLIKNYKTGVKFTPSSDKMKATYRKRKATFSEVEQSISNQICCNNPVIQKELQNKTSKLLEVDMSLSTISRKIKKIRITRKRLTLIPEERNSAANLDARAIYASKLSRISLENLIFLDKLGLTSIRKENMVIL